MKITKYILKRGEICFSLFTNVILALLRRKMIWKQLITTNQFGGFLK